MIGIIVTGLVIISVGVTGVLGNVINKKLTESESGTGFWEMLMNTSFTLPTEDFVGVINVVGEIGPSSDDIWSYADGTYDHDLYMDYIDQMMQADNNKGIILYIDTPGGTVYESDELYLKLMEYKKETGRPIWAYFASQACSGGYYIAMAADYIYANRNCWTGSIGVVISMVNCEGLYEKLGIEEINIVSGPNKAMGAAGTEMTQEQYDIMQSLVDEAYDQFVGIVSKGRAMSEERTRELADGRIYSAQQAKEADLIDVIGSFEEEQKAFIEKEGLSEFVFFHEPSSMSMTIVAKAYNAIANLKEKTDSQIATEIVESNRNGVLMYYAE